METGETGVPGDLGQTVQYLVEVEAKEEAGRDNVIIQNLSMEEMNVREMTKKRSLRSAIQMLVQVIFFSNVDSFSLTIGVNHKHSDLPKTSLLSLSYSYL